MAFLFSSKFRKDRVAAVAAVGCSSGPGRMPTKVLMKVIIQNSLGPVQVIISPENTVGDLIKAAVKIYMKEKRRPLLPSGGDFGCFELHYSQFDIEGLEAEEKLRNLGSRNFFLCPK